MGIAELRTRFSRVQLAFSAGRFDELCQQVGPLADDARRRQSWHMVSQCLSLRGAAHLRMHRRDAARDDLREAIRVAWLTLDGWNAALALWTLPQALAHLRQPELAQQLAGFIGSFWVQRFSPLNGNYEQALRRTRRVAAAQIDARASATAFEAGSRLSLAEAVTLALATAP